MPSGQPREKKTRKKHVNIPIFIPHEGCPNGCIYCSQRTITGCTAPADRDIRPEIDRALATVARQDDASAEKTETEAEIAFFGGSFTGIDRKVMIRLLRDAAGYLADGRAASIRISTRPDYIDGEVLSILAAYGVKHIELGIQSTDDEVLRRAARGHDAACAKNACRAVCAAGFVLGGQMMLGLPGSTPEAECRTARDICRWGAREARIYPTVVFSDTPLCELAKSGAYAPLTLDDAVCRAAACYEIFLDAGVNVLRVGLQAADTLSPASSGAVYAGAAHPAFGELCESALYRTRLLAALEAQLSDRNAIGEAAAGGPFTLTVACAPGAASKAAGHGGTNRAALADALFRRGFPRCRIRFVETSGVLPFMPRLYLSASPSFPPQHAAGKNKFTQNTTRKEETACT